MNTTAEPLRFMIAGGGTGGHIFPALAIADALKRRFPNCSIQFVGAQGRMEMERVPAAGYPIKSLPVMGFNRKHLWKNIKVAFVFFKAIKLAKKYIQEYKPHFVIGVGGYVSLPILLTAQNMGLPTLIQEQNSYAGMANKKLAARAKAICVAYEGMERFFPQERIVLTGNPLRPALEKEPLPNKMAAAERLGFHNFTAQDPFVAIVGGSLGALTINESIASSLPKMVEKGVRVLWQTGKNFYPLALKARENLAAELQDAVVVTPFIENMQDAYGVADLFISRAGASTVSELQFLGQPSILVPSPNVAEDHQRKNAEALVKHNAAVMVLDADARASLVDKALELVTNPAQLHEIGRQAKEMALPDAADKIVDLITSFLENEEHEQQ